MEDFGKLILSHADGLDQEFILNKSLVTLGRSTTNDIVLMEGRVSRNHAQFQCSQEGITLTDLGSANGSGLTVKGSPKQKSSRETSSKSGILS
jgi:pSer/pThr/pTyr-binding forkhead associated (FHA) protein